MNKQIMNKFVRGLCSNKLAMNLQLFSEGDNDAGDGITETSGEEAITFKSQSDLDSWFDNKLAKSLETAKTKWDKDAQKRIEAAEKKGKMTAEEQTQYEIQKEREELEADRKALKRDQDEATIIKRLSSDKLPDSLSEVLAPLYGGEEEALNETYENMSKAFTEAVEKAVNLRLVDSADSPAAGGGSTERSLGSQYAKQANSRKESPKNLWK
ncbi:putative scaffold protein [Enterococcus faecalis AZ19]|uniref:DUF4355 domain-containing protein n=1 Tax=Enterococcus faecalis TaxID=1351 RepID=UPI00045B922F|nr:DUF4355 domain-containing protein [Enterococcus faecalis]KAJ76033.1 putative scaffold protein [Enterococcus faecalis AZ19]